MPEAKLEADENKAVAVVEQVAVEPVQLSEDVLDLVSKLSLVMVEQPDIVYDPSLKDLMSKDQILLT